MGSNPSHYTGSGVGGSFNHAHEDDGWHDAYGAPYGKSAGEQAIKRDQEYFKKHYKGTGEIEDYEYENIAPSSREQFMRDEGEY